MQKPAFKMALAEFQESTDECLTRLANKEIRKLQVLLDEEDKKLSPKACEIVLGHFYSSQRKLISSEAGMITFTSQINNDGTIIREIIEG